MFPEDLGFGSVWQNSYVKPGNTGSWCPGEKKSFIPDFPFVQKLQTIKIHTMGIFSWFFGNKERKSNQRKRENQPDVYDIPNKDDRMNWAMEKARLTLHYFEKCICSVNENQSYFSIKVKIVDGDKAEHIWLTEPAFDGEGNLYGVIGNDLIDVKNVKINQRIGIDRALVSDWMIIENGRLIGGYTIRAVREGFSGKELAKFDKSLGGMYIDEGEDHFIPGPDTPEGAILQLEEAYDADDIEKAVNCKDFDKEAALMLKKMGKGDFGDDIIKKTSEVLKLSFIKSLQEGGMPKFHGIKRAFPERQKISDNHYIITEVCFYPDGGKSSQKINTYRTGAGWKVLNPES